MVAEAVGSQVQGNPERDAVLGAASRARDAAAELRLLTRERKDLALRAIAAALEASTAEVVAANSLDVDRAVASDTDPAIVDRLTLDAGRIAAIAQAVREVAALPDPVGDVVRGYRLLLSPWLGSSGQVLTVRLLQWWLHQC